jgi:hypothetical protein
MNRAYHPHRAAGCAPLEPARSGRRAAREGRPPAVDRVTAFVDRAKTFVDRAKAFVDRAKAFVDRAKTFVASAKTFVDRAKAFVAPAKTFVDRVTGFVDRAKVFVDRAKVFVDRAKAFVDRAKTFVASAKTFVDRAKAFVAPAKTFVDRAKDFVDRAKAFVDRAKAFVAPARAFVDRAKAFVAPAKAFVDRAKVFVDPAKAFFAPAMAFVDRAKAFVAPAMAFVDRAKAFVAPARAFVAPAQAFAGPARAFARSTRGWGFSLHAPGSTDRRVKPAAVAALTLALGSLGCSSAPPPAPVATLVVPPVVAPPPAPSAEPAAPAALDAPIPLYPVARIYSLFDLVVTDGGVELRLGLDPGGGVTGIYRFVPLVDGAPDFERESADIFRAYTSGGFLELVGKRPDLILHEASGFRSSSIDSYRFPDRESALRPIEPGKNGAIGLGIFPWSKGRWLEWRGPQPEAHAGEKEAVLPRMRVLYGSDKDAPTLPRALEAQLTKAWFVVDTLTAFRSGEVVAAGRLKAAKGFGTLIWKDDLRQPRYFVTEAVTPEPDGSDLTILGGTSLADVRLKVADKVLRLDGAGWSVESTVPEGAPPDVWFGSPLLQYGSTGVLVRLAKGAPWRPITRVVQEEHVVVDPAGVIWKTEDDLLLSSKPPARPLLEISEHDLVQRRKASVLRGGYTDETGEEPHPWMPSKCTTHYVLLDQSPEAAAPGDYPRIRAALQGHPELGAARFLVSRESRFQLFGALVADEAVADKIASLVRKRVRSAPAQRLCAQPVPVREIKIDLRSGEVVK